MSTKSISGASETSTMSCPSTHPLAQSGQRLGRRLVISKRLTELSLPVVTIYSHRDTDEYKARHDWPQYTPKAERGYPTELGIEDIISTSFQPGEDWSPLSGLACNIDYERAVSALEEECDRIQTIISAHRIDRHVDDKTDTKFCDSMIGTIEDFRGTRLLAHMRPAVLSVLANLHRGLDEAAKKGLTDNMEEDVESVVKSVFALDAKVMEPWTGDDGTMFRADTETVRKAKALGNFDMAMADMTERRAGHPVSLMSRLQIIESGWQHHRVGTPTHETHGTHETAIDQDLRDQLTKDITEGILGLWSDALYQPGPDANTGVALASTMSNLRKLSAPQAEAGSNLEHSRIAMWKQGSTLPRSKAGDTDNELESLGSQQTALSKNQKRRARERAMRFGERTKQAGQSRSCAPEVLSTGGQDRSQQPSASTGGLTPSEAEGSPIPEHISDYDGSSEDDFRLQMVYDPKRAERFLSRNAWEVVEDGTTGKRARVLKALNIYQPEHSGNESGNS